LAALVLQGHRELQQLQVQHPAHRSMATTLTVAIIKGGELVAAHCGDTRLYVARGNGIKRLSEDHSEGVRLYKEGLLSRKELFNYPRKHILESALGVAGDPTIQEIDFDLNADDWIIIASDGAYTKLTTVEMRDIGRAARKPQEFVDACREIVRVREPADNYTLVAVRISE
jgi:protein phosphatase